jgi:hypothetical protein
MHLGLNSMGKKTQGYLTKVYKFPLVAKGRMT